MRKLRAIVGSAFGWLTGRPSMLEKPEFTELYAAALRETMPDSNIQVTGELQLQIAGPGEHDHAAFLDNCYAEYRLAPHRRDEIVARYIKTCAPGEVARDEIDANQIVPIIKDRGWLTEVDAALRARGNQDVPEHVYETLNDELVIVFAVDNPRTIQYLTSATLAAANVPREELRERAVTNLKRLLPKIEVHGGDGTYMVTAGGTYEACLLLLDHIWSERQLEVRGDYVIAIPNRDLLLVTGAEDAAGIRKLRELARNTAAKGPYHLTSDLFTYREGRFRRFEA